MIVQTDSVASLLGFLTPYDVSPYSKIRVGNHYGDGGYILLDRLDPRQVVYSFGIGANPTFDRDMAERGHQIYMFDHTIERIEAPHQNFHFFREGLTGTEAPTGDLHTLVHFLDRFGRGDNDLLLKMDVEGAEWTSLAGTPSRTLRLFEQITLELHNFHQIENHEFRKLAVGVLRRFAHDFVLFHVHANNHADIVVQGGFPVCPVIEVSYVRRDLVSGSASRTVYPTPLDTPCNPIKRDFLLGFYPFAPLIDDADRLRRQVEEAAVRIDYQFHLQHTRNQLREARSKENV